MNSKLRDSDIYYLLNYYVRMKKNPHRIPPQIYYPKSKLPNNIALFKSSNPTLKKILKFYEYLFNNDKELGLSKFLNKSYGNLYPYKELKDYYFYYATQKASVLTLEHLHLLFNFIYLLSSKYFNKKQKQEIKVKEIIKKFSQKNNNEKFLFYVESHSKIPTDYFIYKCNLTKTHGLELKLYIIQASNCAWNIHEVYEIDFNKEKTKTLISLVESSKIERLAKIKDLTNMYINKNWINNLITDNLNILNCECQCHNPEGEKYPYNKEHTTKNKKSCGLCKGLIKELNKDPKYQKYRIDKLLKQGKKAKTPKEQRNIHFNIINNKMSESMINYAFQHNTLYILFD